MKKLTIIALLFTTGCTMLHTNQSNTTKEGVKVETKASIYTFFGGKSDLTKFRTTNTDKTQGVGVGSLAQESSGTNVISVLDSLTKLVDAAGKAVPK